MREGHLFHKRLVLARQWDIYLKARFESLRTFLPSLFCLGLETKGAKIPPPLPPPKKRKKKKKFRDSVVIPLSKSFYFKPHLGFSLHPWKPYCLSMDVHQHHSERIGSGLILQSLCTGTVTSSALQFFSEILSHVLYDRPICNTLELHLGWLLTHLIQSRVSENFCKVVSSQHSKEYAIVVGF